MVGFPQRAIFVNIEVFVKKHHFFLHKEWGHSINYFKDDEQFLFNYTQHFFHGFLITVSISLSPHAS